MEELKMICREYLKLMNDPMYREAIEPYCERPMETYGNIMTGLFSGLGKIVMDPCKKEIDRLEDPSLRFINRTETRIQDLFLAEAVTTFCDEKLMDKWSIAPPVKNVKEIVSLAFRKFDCIRWSGNYDFENDPYACLMIVSECVKGYAQEICKI